MKIRISLAAIAACLLSMCTGAMAQNVTNWATWTIPAEYPLTLLNYPAADYAGGTTGTVIDPVTGQTVNMTISGEVLDVSAFPYAWPVYPSSSDRSQYLSVVSPTDVAGAGFLGATGDTLPEYKAHTLTFSQDVENAIMPIVSLGRPGTAGVLTFSQPFVVLSDNTLLTASGDGSAGYKLTGYEGNGVIQFLGTYDTISWVVTGTEIWHGTSIGLTTPDNPDAGVPVAVYDIFADGAVTRPKAFGVSEVPVPEAEPQSVLERVLARIDTAKNLGQVNGTYANIAENIGGADGSGIDGSITNIAAGVTAAATQAAATAGASAGEYLLPSVDFGDMATTSLGAVNTGEIALGVNASVYAATTRATQSLSARTGQLGGSSEIGVLVLNVAANMASVNGAINNSLSAVNGATGNLSTTVLGAVNSGSISSGVNASVQGIVGMGG
jgi:hypothetical protein